MGKNRHNMQQLVLEDLQETEIEIIKVDVIPDPDVDQDMGSLPGCIGIHGQPEQGYECSTCYHQQICRATTPTATIIDEKS